MQSGDAPSSSMSGRFVGDAACVLVGGVDAGRPGRSDAGDVCGEEVDAVSVEVASGAVVVLGGAGV